MAAKRVKRENSELYHFFADKIDDATSEAPGTLGEGDEDSAPNGDTTNARATEPAPIVGEGRPTSKPRRSQTGTGGGAAQALVSGTTGGTYHNVNFHVLDSSLAESGVSERPHNLALEVVASLPTLNIQPRQQAVLSLGSVDADIPYTVEIDGRTCYWLRIEATVWKSSASVLGVIGRCYEPSYPADNYQRLVDEYQVFDSIDEIDKELANTRIINYQSVLLWLRAEFEKAGGCRIEVIVYPREQLGVKTGITHHNVIYRDNVELAEAVMETMWELDPDNGPDVGYWAAAEAVRYAADSVVERYHPTKWVIFMYGAPPQELPLGEHITVEEDGAALAEVTIWADSADQALQAFNLKRMWSPHEAVEAGAAYFKAIRAEFDVRHAYQCDPATARAVTVEDVYGSDKLVSCRKALTTTVSPPRELVVISPGVATSVATQPVAIRREQRVPHRADSSVAVADSPPPLWARPLTIAADMLARLVSSLNRVPQIEAAKTSYSHRLTSGARATLPPGEQDQ